MNSVLNIFENESNKPMISNTIKPKTANPVINMEILFPL